MLKLSARRPPTSSPHRPSPPRTRSRRRGHPLENKHQPASPEGGAIRGERFTGETKKALGGEEPGKEAEPMKDDEGEEASGKDVAASMQKAEVRHEHPPSNKFCVYSVLQDADAPKDAKASEEDSVSVISSTSVLQLSCVCDYSPTVLLTLPWVSSFSLPQLLVVSVI